MRQPLLMFALILAMTCKPPAAGPAKPSAFDADNFAPLPAPGPTDWLAAHSEKGQNYEQFLHSPRNRPDARRRILYLQPIGDVDAALLEKLRRFTHAYFVLEVRVLEPLPIDRSITSRDNGGLRQYLAPDFLALLRRQLPDDAFCVLGVTNVDLYPQASWNFAFGVGSFTDRVGVYSLARYGDAQPLLLRRSCKVLAHETLHMFGMAHCIWYRCVLNGSNSLPEMDARPLQACPVELRKLSASVHFDPLTRYRAILEFCREAGLEEEARWLEREIARLES